MRSLDDDEKGLITIQTPGGPQEVSVVTEAGLYSLILRSGKRALPLRAPLPFLGAERSKRLAFFPLRRREGEFSPPFEKHRIFLQPKPLAFHLSFGHPKPEANVAGGLPDTSSKGPVHYTSPCASGALNVHPVCVHFGARLSS